MDTSSRTNISPSEKVGEASEKFLEIFDEEEFEQQKAIDVFKNVLEKFKQDAEERGRLETKVEYLEGEVEELCAELEWFKEYVNETLTVRGQKMRQLDDSVSQLITNGSGIVKDEGALIAARDPNWVMDKPKTDGRALEVYNKLLTMKGNGVYRCLKSSEARGLLGVEDMGRSVVHRVFDRVVVLCEEGVFYREVRCRMSRDGERMVFMNDF